MKFYGKRRYNRKRATKRAPYKKRASKSSTTITRVVKRILHSQIENKKIITYVPNQTLASCLVLPNLLTISMIPYSSMAQGTGQAARIGNKIRTMKCIMKYVITPYPHSVTLNPTPRPHNVIMMFGKVKNTRPLTPISTDFANLFQTSNTSAPPQGTIGDLVLAINKDYFTVYKTVVHKVGYEGFNNAGVSPAYQHYQNNDYKMNIIGSLNLTKHCPKNVIFNDATVQPTNDGLYCWAWAVPADGSTYAALTPLIITYNILYEYEDA